MQFVKIPIKILCEIVKNRSDIKAYVTYLQLKSLYKHQTIHNIRGRKKEIAGFLGISENTFRSRLGHMRQLNLCLIENNILRLRHSYILFETFQLKKANPAGRLSCKRI